MLAKRVILQLCFVEGVLFRTKRFNADLRYTQAFSWSGDADEMVLVDISPTPWEPWPDFIADYTLRKGVDIPVCANCRIPDVEYARKILNYGADKLLIAYKRRSIYRDISEAFGAQALVAGIHYGSETSAADVCLDCIGAEGRGAGEILLTSIERDGSLSGFDIRTLRDAVSQLHSPVVVAGGCGSWQHMRQAFEAGASGAATSNIYHLSQTSMRSCKQWLSQNYSGPVRPAECVSTSPAVEPSAAARP
jgi:imidazole glycerol-phosphate synthase subunit HisF